MLLICHVFAVNKKKGCVMSQFVHKMRLVELIHFDFVLSLWRGLVKVVAMINMIVRLMKQLVELVVDIAVVEWRWIMLWCRLSP